MKKKELIVDPYFIIGLFVLILNDFYLKQRYGNFLTGKLSDFSGLLIFPLFVAVLFPKLKRSISLITGIGFFLWKLPIMDVAIDWINQYSFFAIGRVVDYSDYMALLILPFSHFLINRKRENYIIPFNRHILSFSRYGLLAIAFISFCATSMVPRFTPEMPKGTIYIGKSYDIKLSKDSIINAVRNLGYDCVYHQDSAYYRGRITQDSSSIKEIGYYQTNNIITYSDYSMYADTLTNVKYELTEIKPNKTRLTIINVTLPRKGNIQDWKQLKLLSEQYESWLKDNLIKKVK